MNTAASKTKQSSPVLGAARAALVSVLDARIMEAEFDAAEQSYVGKLMDACDTEDEANAIMDFYAG